MFSNEAFSKRKAFSKRTMLGAVGLVALGCSVLFAQNLKLSALEKKNREIADREMREILQYGHLEVAGEVMAESYIQHNPNVPNGRAGFLKAMGNRKPDELQPGWKNPPTMVITSGPFVLYMFERKDKDPDDPAKEYTWDHFDMLRVENGKIQEHWDEVEKHAP
jgi:predicted SnoaL-like aldol condensation-catalyzing enzyme